MNVTNRKAFYNYFIEDRHEAGLVLEGWEVKAIRANGAQITEAHVKVIDGALYLIGSHITPLVQASTHVRPDPTRLRKLLMKKSELNKLIGRVEQRGYTIVPLNLHFKHGFIKLEIGLARGKKQHDKRAAIKERDIARDMRDMK